MSKVGSMHREITNSLEENAQIKTVIARSKVGEIESMVNLIITAYEGGGKVVLWTYRL